MKIPNDWRLIAESGDSGRGSVIVGSVLCNFEFSWVEAKKMGRKTVTLEALFDEMIKRLQKHRKNVRMLKRSSGEIFGHNMLYFHYASTDKGYGIAWYCDKDEKFFRGIFRFKPETGSKSKVIFRNILNSFRCHSQGKGRRNWSLFGFSLTLPSDFELVDKDLLVGRLSLHFYKERGGLTVHKEDVYFQYWGPADVNFEDTYSDLEAWFHKYQAKDFWKRYKARKKKKFELKDFEINGHEGKTFSTPIQKRALIPEKGKLNTYMWYCYDTNRIYQVTLSHVVSKIPFLPVKKYEKNPDEAFNEIMNSISCH